MMRSLYSAISGLKNHQIEMDVIGNNIANVNTPGFKRSRVTFATTLSQTLKGASSPSANQGGTNPAQIGLGSILGSIDQIMTPGSAQSTGKNTDMMLEGSGFFVLNNNGTIVYTRSGGFNLEENGYLDDPASGARVQGFSWGADDTVSPTFSGSNYGSIRFAKGDVLPLDTNLPLTLSAASFNGTQGPGQTKNGYPTFQSDSLKNAVNVSISGMTQVSPVGTRPIGTNEFDFDATTGTITFADGYNPATNPQSVSYQMQLTTPALGGTGWSSGDTVYTDAANLIGATGVTIKDSTNATLTAPADYTFDNTTGAITFASSPANPPLTIDYTPADSPVSIGGVGFNVPPYQLTDTNLIGAGDLSINGMKQVPLGQTPSAGEYSFDPTKGLLTFVAGFDPTTPPVDINYAKSMSLNGADGIMKTFSVDYPPTSGATIYAGTTSPYSAFTLGADPANLGASEYAINVVNGKYQITFGTAPAAGAKVGYDFVNKPHTLENFSIDQSGVVTGVYSNGVDSITHKIAQVAVASFANDAGLENVGGSFYIPTNNSGTASIGAAGEEGRATIVSSEVEMSNVDLSQEFTDMIVAQRGFQANSRVITVSDTLLQELIDLKRQ
ncbi:flagellar hook protein FlgE [Desulfitobacterium sp. AusDCA]|uniref:flagellar hook protein FlgE n=1 Tax=Desulfitobacterium sp. AusDCA TaxID=3240383 RepID=UPI003DA74917